MTKHINNKEQSILEAAKAEFFEKGYDGARTTSIARAAGVTHAMLHYYFKTKEQLFRKIFSDIFNELLSNISEVFASQGGSINDRIEKMVSLHFDFIKKNPKIPLFVIREIARPEICEIIKETLQDKLLNFFKNVNEDFGAASQRGEIIEIDIPTLMIDMLALNATPFVVLPLVSRVLEIPAEGIDTFLENRKRETIELLTRRLIITK